MKTVTIEYSRKQGGCRVTISEILARLESLGDESRRKHNSRVGPDGTAPPGSQFGVKAGDIRALARKIKVDKAAALQLWETGNLEAQMLAAILLKPRELSAGELDALLRSTSCAQAAEWMNSYVVARHPDREALRAKWMKSREPWTARAAWHLTASLVNQGAGGELDLGALLDRIEKELPKARPEVRWTMNNTLIAIGVQHAAHRARAVAIGEKIGLYKDWPVSKGCVIPYVPVCVPELVKRKH